MSNAVLDPPIDPTVEVDRPMSSEEVRICPGCGKPESQWKENLGRGHLADDGHTYCCTGCAQETGCTCV